MNEVRIAISSALLGLVAVSHPAVVDARSAAPLARASDDKEAVPLDEVPALVKQAAVDAVPGFLLERAFRETEDGLVMYDLEGTADAKRVEVEVTAEGKVLEIEWDGEAQK